MNGVVYAVFSRDPRERLTTWMTWEDAQRAYACGYTNGDRTLDRVVRSSVDPAWCGAEYRVPAAQPAKRVRLTADERERLLALGRAAGDLEGAKDRMLNALCSDARFEHLPADELSDYAWAAAKFCYPREWSLSWA